MQDTLFVTDEAGRKITDPNRQRELRTATGFCSQEAQELHFGVPAGGTAVLTNVTQSAGGGGGV